MSINQKKKGEYATISHTPKMYVKAYLQNKWVIVLDTFKSPNDKNGNYITINRIMLNEELTKKAFENQAMRAAWDDKRQCFYLDGNHNYQMLTDIVKWLQPVVGIPKGTSSVSGGCYVATSVYGSYDCPQVWTLRRYRDLYLSKYWYGRLFIKCYYAISPTVVRLFGETKWFKRMWKSRLDILVHELNQNGFDDTPYND